MTIIELSRSTEEEFDLFCGANSFESILSHFNQLCALLVDTPTDHPWCIYKELKARLNPYWKAAALFQKLDARAKHTEYAHQSVCSGMNIVVIGCGPCGLRCAIEMALLGARVVILEKRDTFSRNNVVHLWPYLIEDLRALGAKTFLGKFCAGSIDHISIRALQCILLKTALLFGVQVFPGVSYVKMLEPIAGPPTLSNGSSIERLMSSNSPNGADSSLSDELLDVCKNSTNSHSTAALRDPATNVIYSSTRSKVGWRVQVEPALAALTTLQVDVLVAADGKRSCIGFPRKELRCRLAIAITANFVNYHTQAEAEVEEISGVARVFNQSFFAKLAEENGVDLENIVYYKDDTHYFVMTAKKHSLLARGVLKQDREDSESLMSADNIDLLALQAYARDTANYATKGQLPRLDFARNARGEPDVDAFDFTQIYAAEYSCRLIERKRQLVMQCLIGDGLFEPFWPTGSGCALGFLGALDAAWAVSRLAAGVNPMQVVSERESVYQRLSQTTAQNMPSNFADYRLDPRTRYTHCNLNVFGPHHVRHLYSTDVDKKTRSKPTDLPHLSYTHQTNNNHNYTKTLSSTMKNGEKRLPGTYLDLLRWFQCKLAFYNSCGLTESPLDLNSTHWQSGTQLLCLLHLYRPDLVTEVAQFLRAAASDSSKRPDPQTVFQSKGTTESTLARAFCLYEEHFGLNLSLPCEKSVAFGLATLATGGGNEGNWPQQLISIYRVLSPLKSIQHRRLMARAATPDAPNPIRTCKQIRRTTPRQGNRAINHRATMEKAQENNNSTATRPGIRGVFREDAAWSVEKGLLLKRRAELIATLKDPASAKRRTPVLSSRILHSERFGSSRSASPSGRRSISIVATYEPPVSDEKSSLKRSQSIGSKNGHGAINPVVIPDTVSRLFAPRQGSWCCYICHKKLYLLDRQTAFGLYFHRNCFRCTVCGLALHADNATRVPASAEGVADKFYCLPHSKSLVTQAVRAIGKSDKLVNVSMVDRLRTGQFPFGRNKTTQPHETTPSLSVLTRGNVPEPPQRMTTAPARSALCTGLSEKNEKIMGVVDVRALIQQYRQPQPQFSASASSSSTSSATSRRDSPNRLRPRLLPTRHTDSLGPGGDGSRLSPTALGVGIRDENAPAPDCFLAGHLGLPELERRRNWELNTNTLRWNDSPLAETFEQMRSSESENPLPNGHQCVNVLDPHLPAPTSTTGRHFRKRRSRRKPLPLVTAPSDADTPSITRSTEPGEMSSSTFSSSTNNPPDNSLPPNPLHSSPAHQSLLAAKQRFCMEPPKPVTIDPHQFISAKNLERTILSALTDYTETCEVINPWHLHECITTTIVPDAAQLVPNMAVPYEPPILLHGPSVQVNINSYRPLLPIESVVSPMVPLTLLKAAPYATFEDTDSTDPSPLTHPWGLEDDFAGPNRQSDSSVVYIPDLCVSPSEPLDPIANTLHRAEGSSGTSSADLSSALVIIPSIGKVADTCVAILPRQTGLGKLHSASLTRFRSEPWNLWSRCRPCIRASDSPSLCTPALGTRSFENMMP